MASYTVANGEQGALSKTLTASTVDTVTFADEFDLVEVLNVDGAAKIYFTVDGSTPTVAGAKTHELPAQISARVVSTGNVTTVKVISGGTPVYSVARAD